MFYIMRTVGLFGVVFSMKTKVYARDRVDCSGFPCISGTLSTEIW